MRPGRLTTRARTRGVALAVFAATLPLGCGTADRVPSQPFASQLPRPTNITADPRPVPLTRPNQSREFAVGQTPPSAAQLAASDQPNQQPALGVPTILKNPATIGLTGSPPPPVTPVAASPTGLVMPAMSGQPAARVSEPVVLPPNVELQSPPMPPPR